jgi:hypothetical protein
MWQMSEACKAILELHSVHLFVLVAFFEPWMVDNVESNGVFGKPL